MSEIKTSDVGERYLTFSLGEEEFAIPLLAVKEVLAMPEVTPVPQTPNHFLGIINLRGQVISLMDLRTKLTIKPKSDAETAAIICDLSGMTLGVVVDSVNSVLTVEEKFLSDKPQIQGSKAQDYVTAVYRKNDKLILFLNIARSLSLEEKALLQNQNKAA